MQVGEKPNISELRAALWKAVARAQPHLSPEERRKANAAATDVELILSDDMIAVLRRLLCR